MASPSIPPDDEERGIPGDAGFNDFFAAHAEESGPRTMSTAFKVSMWTILLFSGFIILIADGVLLSQYGPLATIPVGIAGWIGPYVLILLILKKLRYKGLESLFAGDG